MDANENNAMSLKQVNDWLFEFGSPLFVFDQRAFIENLRTLKGQATSSGLNADFLYSYKTCPVTAVCQLAHFEGFGAEVVSESELKQAIKIGVPGNRIFFNGPIKTTSAINSAISAGAYIHADSIEELSILLNENSSDGAKFKVGARVRVDAGTETWSKFGIGPCELLRFLQSADTKSRRFLKGLHIHIGSNIYDLNIYRLAIKQLTKILFSVEKLLGMELEYLDVGGGLAAGSAIPLDMRLEEWRPPTLDAYIDVIAEELRESNLIHRPVIFELGRWVLADCMSYLFKIHNVKSIDQQHLALTDGNINHVPSVEYFYHNIFSIARGPKTKRKVDLYGPTCAQFDRLGLDRCLQYSDPGDILCMEDVGAYNIAFSNQFTQPRPAVIGINNGRAELIRKREPISDFWQHDVHISLE